MSDSTKRAIRTLVQCVLGVSAAIAVAIPLLPPSTGRTAAIIAGAGLAAATIAKIWAALEDAGKIPPWLKTNPAQVARLTEAQWNEAWHAGHTAATAERAGTWRGANDATMIRPLAGVEEDAPPAVILDSRRRTLEQDEPGKHSPDREYRVPTSERARPTGAWSAAAPPPGRPQHRGNWADPRLSAVDPGEPDVR